VLNLDRLSSKASPGVIVALAMMAAAFSPFLTKKRTGAGLNAETNKALD